MSSIAAQLSRVATETRILGMYKTAYILDRLVESATKPSGFLWPLLVGGGLGALIAGEGQRPEGAIAGIIGGTIGRSLISPLGRRVATQMASLSPTEVKALASGAGRKGLEALHNINPSLSKSISSIETGVGEAGRALGAAGGGYALRAKSEHDRQKGLTEPQQVMYDIGGKYTGFLPDELNDAGLFGF